MIAYNEEKNLAQVMAETVGYLEQREAQGILKSPHLVIVDDGSTDGTYEKAVETAAGRGWIQVVRHLVNRGIGAALRTGYGKVRGEWITFLPADGQIAPVSIDALLDNAREADLVLSVYGRRDDSAFRLVLSKGLRLATWLLAGARVRSEGIYLVRRDVLDALPLRSDSFFLNLELPIRAKWAGFRLAEACMEARPRLSGSTKVVSPGRIARVVKDLLLLRLERLGLGALMGRSHR